MKRMAAVNRFGQWTRHESVVESPASPWRNICAASAYIGVAGEFYRGASI